MRRVLSRLQFLLVALLLTFGLVRRASANATVANAVAFGSTVSGVEVATEKSQFIFRAVVHSNGSTGTPAVNYQLRDLASGSVIYRVDHSTNPGTVITAAAAGVQVYAILHVFDGDNAGNLGAGKLFAMTQQSGDNANKDGHSGVYRCIVRADDLFPASPNNHNWEVFASDNDTDNTKRDAFTGGTFRVVNGTAYVSTDRTTNIGNSQHLGVTLDPVDNSSPDAGGSSNYYTFRARVWTDGGVPPQYMQRRTDATHPFDWRDSRYDGKNNWSDVTNTGVIMVLTDPSNQEHYLPMEVDPEFNSGLLHQSLYQAVHGGTATSPNNEQLVHAVLPDNRLDTHIGNPPGVVYRYRMMPSAYIANNDNQMRPILTYGTATWPLQPGGSTDAQVFSGHVVSEGNGSEVFARPYANGYAAFALSGAGATSVLQSDINFSSAGSAFTNGRCGVWKWRVLVNTELRPIRDGVGDRAGNASNINYPVDSYGATVADYNVQDLSTTGNLIGSFNDLTVGPFLTDGGWTDDLFVNGPLLPEATDPTYGYPQTEASRKLAPLHAHRSRVTTRTTVRYMVRFTTDSSNPGMAVRVNIDGVYHDMQPLDNAPLTAGRRYYYDTLFTNPEGGHYYWFEATDGNHTVIWPRRDVDTAQTRNTIGNPIDTTGSLIPGRTDLTGFFGTQVGKNYVNHEPVVNHRPTLVPVSGANGPTVAPQIGDGSKPFVFTIKYTDVDGEDENGDEPIVTDVVIDGVPHRMTAVADTNTGTVPAVSAGRTYQFTLNALRATADNKHNYYFRFRERWRFVNETDYEAGEWITYPAGDDGSASGGLRDGSTPATMIHGPTIVANNAPVLSDAALVPSNPNPPYTGSTQFDVQVTYSDADGTAPSYVRAHIYGSDLGTNPNALNLTYSLQPLSGNDPAAGIRYHLATLIQLPVSAPGVKYLVEFAASDGVQPTTSVRVGTGATALSDGSAQSLLPVATPGNLYAAKALGRIPATAGWNTDFQVGTGSSAINNGSWRGLTSTDNVNFADPLGTSNWKNNTELWVWKIPANTSVPATLLTRGTDYTLGGLQNNTVQLATPAAAGDAIVASFQYTDPTSVRVWDGTTPVTVGTSAAIDPTVVDLANGTVTLPVASGAGIRASYFYKTLVVPAITNNNAPVLSEPTGTPNNGTINQLTGSPNTQFTYTVKYSDPDGQAPATINVVIDGTAHAMTAVLDGGTTTVDYTQPIRYTYTTTLAIGTHQYHFEASDGTTQVRLPAADNQTPDYSGPTVQDSAPLNIELVNARYTTSAGTIVTSATQFDFMVTYAQHSGVAPANYAGWSPASASGVQVRVSTDGGQSFGQWYDMAPAAITGSTNYATGVQYHLPATLRFPAGSVIRYEFRASDGTTQTNYCHVGSGQDAITTGTAHSLTAVSGQTRYADLGGTLNWSTSSPLYVWKGAGPAPALLDRTSTTPAYSVDAANGAVVLTAPNSTGDPIRASYYYTDNVGPTVAANHAPTLSGPGADGTNNYLTVTPLTGAANATYTFSVVYTDADGQAPSSVQVYIDGTAHAMQPATAGTPDYTAGVRYVFGMSLASGLHRYRFTTSDSVDNATLPVATADNPSADFSGPNVGSTSILTNATITPSPKGKHDDLYTFKVTYSDQNGNPPSANPEARITLEGSSQTTYLPLSLVLSGGAADYVNGVDFQATVHGSQIGSALAVPGSYSVVFGFAGQTTGLTPRTLIVNGVPTVDTPTISATTVAQSGQLTFTVRFTDANDEPAANATGGLLIDGTPSSVVPTTPANPSYKNGVVYTWVVSAGTLTVGSHTYQFSLTDGTEAAPAVPASAQSFTVTSAAVPQLTNGSVTPGTGLLGDAFTYSVTYTHADGSAPTLIRVLVDEGTSNAKTFDLTTTNASPNYTTGVVYSYTTTSSQIAAGSHTFRFVANDAVPVSTGYRVTFPANGSLTGPTVAYVPTLANGTVVLVRADGSTSPTTDPAVDNTGALTPAVTGDAYGNFRFKVTYKNEGGTAPDSVNLVIGSTTVPMSAVSNAPSYTTGAVYKAERQLAAGAVTFHFEVMVDGRMVRFPATGEIHGLTVTQAANFGTITYNPSPAQVGQAFTVTGVINSSAALPTGQVVNFSIVKPNGGIVLPAPNNGQASVDTNGGFSFTVPAATVDQTGTWAINLTWTGISGTYPSITKSAAVTVAGWTSATLAPGQVDMISVPLVPVAVDATLALGPSVSISALNLVRYDTLNSQYKWLNSDSSFTVAAGAGYFVKPTAGATLSPKGRLVDQTAPYSITLLPGWNLVGSVFTRPTTWGSTQVRYNGQLQNVTNASDLVRPVAWGYNPTSGSYVMVQAGDNLVPGRAYWVRAYQQVELVLNPSTAAGEFLSRAAVDKTTSLQLVARTADRADTDNFVPLTGGMGSRAQLQQKPPYLANFVSISFTDAAGATLTSSRAAAAGSNAVTFDVNTDKANADVTLQIGNLSAITRKYEVTLTDVASGVSRSLNGNAGYTYNTGNNEAPRQFVLQLQPATYANQLVISGLSANGANRGGSRTFSFQLSGAASVKAEILAGGKVVRNIVAGRSVTAGANQLTWDGRDNKGSAVPTGVYLLKVSGTDDRGHAATAVLPLTVVR